VSVDGVKETLAVGSWQLKTKEQALLPLGSNLSGTNCFPKGEGLKNHFFVFICVYLRSSVDNKCFNVFAFSAN